MTGSDQSAMTPDEATTYRRLWGADPPGYTPEKGATELERRRVARWGARHAMCPPGVCYASRSTDAAARNDGWPVSCNPNRQPWDERRAASDEEQRR